MNQILRTYEDALKITKWDSEARSVLAKPLGVISCDTETSGLLFHTPSYLWDEQRWVDDPFPFGITLVFNQTEPNESKDASRMVLVWGRVGTRLYDECRRILASPNIKTWHNAKYDRRVCKTNGIELNGPQNCTLTMSRIHWNRRQAHGLQELSEFICPKMSDWEVGLNDLKKKLKAHWTRQVKKDKIWLPPGVERNEYFNYSFIPDKIMGKYSMIDGYMAYVLYKKLIPIMNDEYRDLYLRERKIISVVIKIEEAGMGWDIERGKREIAKNKPKIAEALKTFTDLGNKSQENFTTHPPKVVKALKFLGVKEKQLKLKGKVTTGRAILEQCLVEGVSEKAEEFIKSLMNYRDYTKITNTYLKPMTAMAVRNDGIIYTNINPTNTRTGRPACTDPNMLNIPKPKVKKGREENPVRACVVPREGKVIYYFDVAQQEYAVLLLYVEQYEMLKAYTEGADIHQIMADILGRDRDSTKNCNFGVTYGLSVAGMAMMYGLTKKQAKADMDLYRRKFPFIQEFQRKCKSELRQFGYVEDFFGRRYHVPVGQAYKAVNAVVQGGCAQAFKIGLLNVDEHLDYGHRDNAKIILPVYDENQIEVDMEKDGGLIEKPFCQHIIDAMTDIPQLLERGLRLRVDVKKTMTNWAEKVEVGL